MRSSETRYDSVAIALHWLLAALVVGQFGWGWLMQEIPKLPTGVRADAYNVHKSIGITIWALMLVRLGWRIGHPAPALPRMVRWQARLAHANHALLYTLLLLLPVAGYLGSVFSGYPVKYFGVTLPAWGYRSDAIKGAMSAIHFALTCALAGAVVLHVAAAVKHVVDRDGLLQRMWPRSAPRSSRAARVPRAG